MSGSGRMHRVAAAIQEELASLIGQEIKDPRVHEAGLVTVTRVELSPDLQFARVFVSFMGATEAQAEAALEALERAHGWIRGEVGRRLAMRRAPELRILRDRGGDHAARIDAILAEDRARHAETGTSPGQTEPSAAEPPEAEARPAPAATPEPQPAHTTPAVPSSADDPAAPPAAPGEGEPR